MRVCWCSSVYSRRTRTRSREKLADRTVDLRIFADAAKPMNRSVVDVGGAVLVVSQFTLAADTSNGRRPSFTSAAPPDQARALVRGIRRTDPATRRSRRDRTLRRRHAGGVGQRRAGDVPAQLSAETQSFASAASATSVDCVLRSAMRAKNTPSSNRIHIGTASMICDITSGPGVSIMPTTKQPTTT